METKTFVNAGLQATATALVALGAATIGSDLVSGAVEILLGVIVYVAYELFPS